MATSNRTRRSSFPGTAPPAQSVELPVEPLPPDPADGVERRPGAGCIALIPVGQIDDALLDALRPALEEAFHRSAAIMPPLPVPKYAHNPTRGQYHSAAILKRVEEVRDVAWDSAVGIVDMDLFVPEVPFIFGEADRGTRSAIVSLTRLRPEPGSNDVRRDVLIRRLVAETIHQIGLIRGLAQCPNNRCVMFFSATIQDTDKKGAQFCANCRKRLNSES